MIVYHIVLPEIWANFAGKPEYAAESLYSEGFIHCSFATQLDAVLERYYSGIEKVVILEIDPDKLSSRYVEEPSTNNEIYPHIYGPINQDAIVNAVERKL
ncbi:MAG: DUF952 domain-containing protein [Pyrinomonadaceae bacterium]|nr:DUF952 domain-containing protein [Pyrinomonadaceae bacterium]